MYFNFIIPGETFYLSTKSAHVLSHQMRVEEAQKIQREENKIQNIFVLQACVLLAKLNNFYKTLESRATGIHTGVSLRDEM